MGTRHISRAGRIVQFYHLMNELDGYHDGLTMQQIAGLAHMRPSSHVLSILKDMERCGMVTREEIKTPAGLICYLWNVVTGSIIDGYFCPKEGIQCQ